MEERILDSNEDGLLNVGWPRHRRPLHFKVP
ncbi:unnamed protein product [Linum tenue]|uniref:Uncharacterized protein n=1 Tax=Linum tenue TaxID=586396 RepID=A0AAV0NSQ8_9ROSI|nr:unnamed protein product [Linum tenue]